MIHYHFDELSGSDQIVVATPIASFQDKEYRFKRKQYPNIHIPNRALAHRLSFQDDHSEEVEAVRRSVEEYNNYLAKVEAIPGFLDFFKEHGFCISRESVSEKWSEEIADVVFSKKRYCFSTELSNQDGYLFDISIPVVYHAQIEKNIVSLPIGKPDSAYPNTINGKTVIWNWVDNGHDFCFYLWKLLGEPCCQSKELEEDENAVHYDFDAYDQYRAEYVEPQLVNIFQKLESLGYIESYTIKAQQKDPRWVYYGKEDGSVDLALVDMSFLKNKLVMEQIELLLWQREEDIAEQQYFLTDKNGKQYISKHRGTFGGHNKLKIYGKLDCPSAARNIKKGHYVQYRVFFDNEETAMAAGYRPCAICMPEAYKYWKNKGR